MISMPRSQLYCSLALIAETSRKQTAILPVAEGQFGFKGGAEALENVARTSGLCLEHLKGRYFVVIDNAARQLAGL